MLIAMSGTVEQIAISPAESALPETVASVEVLAEQGPRGDRYFLAEPAKRPDGGDLTLIEAEALESFSAETGIPLEPSGVAAQPAHPRGPAQRPGRKAVPGR